MILTITGHISNDWKSRSSFTALLLPYREFEWRSRYG